MEVKEKLSLETLRHSTAHILASAVSELFPSVKLGIGPAIEDGFYYDFDSPITFKEEDLSRIEEKMKKIIEANYPFERIEVSREEAKTIFAARGEKYKLELIDEIEEEPITLYRHGNFVDLCKGPHVPSTGYVKAFKLLSVAGAYWRGKETNPMLQRIYGTAFFSEEELAEYLARLEEAKKRDHRKLGKELDLFSMHEEAGAGLVYWHPKGSRIRTIIEDFWRAVHYQRGYEIVYSPHLGKAQLWEKSGHLDFYSEYMYSPMQIEGEKYYIKPMNCPFHILIYKSKLRSYRELPIRLAELGTVYRYERSGVLHGLLRVRGFTQDDAHIFCRPDQLKDEIKSALELALYMLKAFGFSEYEVWLSTRPQKSVGSAVEWEKATYALKTALEEAKLDYQIAEGEGAFYGPKVDLKIKDTLKRAWQCTTIQLDFNLPERFDLEYVDVDGKRVKPLMIHRALLGSLERFLGILIEHYGGAFPTWLAPIQVRLIPIKDDIIEYAEKIYAQLWEANVRVELDRRSETLNYKIRQAQIEKIPYMLIVGEKEKENNTVSVRCRDGKNLGNLSLIDFIQRIKQESKF